MRLFHLIIFSLATFGSVAFSQESKFSPTLPPSPQPPLVLEIPSGSTFSIRISYGSSENLEDSTVSQNQTIPATDRPILVQFWKDTKNIKILVKHENNVETEGYLFESGFLVRSTANNEQAFVSAAEPVRRSTQTFYTKYFPFTQWLDMKFYKGVTFDENGQAYYEFEQPPTTKPYPVLEPGESPPPDFDPLEYMWLHAKLVAPSKYPHEISIGETSYRFSPVEKWSGVVTMPEQFKQAAEEFTEQLSIIEAFRKKKK